MGSRKRPQGAVSINWSSRASRALMWKLEMVEVAAPPRGTELTRGEPRSLIQEWTHEGCTETMSRTRSQVNQPRRQPRQSRTRQGTDA